MNFRTLRYAVLACVVGTSAWANFRIAASQSSTAPYEVTLSSSTKGLAAWLQSGVLRLNINPTIFAVNWAKLTPGASWTIAYVTGPSTYVADVSNTSTCVTATATAIANASFPMANCNLSVSSIATAISGADSVQIGYKQASNCSTLDQLDVANSFAYTSGSTIGVTYGNSTYCLSVKELSGTDGKLWNPLKNASVSTSCSTSGSTYTVNYTSC